MKKRLVACLLALVFVMSCFPLEILAVEDADSSTASTTALIYAESTYCVIGKTVDVDICILQNPGIAGAKFSVSFDEGLTLIAADEKGGVFEALDYTAPKNLVNSCPFNWDTLDQVASEDGRIMTLTFAVADNVVAGDQLDINISYQYGDIYDSDLNSLSVTMVGGVLDVIDYLPGDVNGDGVINGIDVTLIRRYNADWDIEIDLLAADVNADGAVNGKDATQIRRYNADWDVTLQPGKVVCAAHSLSAVTAKAATCTEAGHTAYWQCTACKACFLDEVAGKEIALSDTVIYAKGHTEVVDEAVAPTYDATGLTEGAHCSACNTVLTAQQIVPQLQASYHSITYRNLNGATSPSKTRYAEHEGLLDLPAVSAPGYKFLGWYTASKDGTLIDYIPAGDTTDYVLYAHWEAIKYKITYTGVQDGFDNGIKEYTVEDGNIYLSKDPEWKHLIFTGWEDQSSKLSYAENGIPMIKSGTTGDIFLKATWKARQNIFNKAEKQYNSSAFNEEDGKYYFFYHLGDLSNVLLQAKEGKGRDHTGVMTTLTTSKSVTVSEEYAKGYATAISNAVKNSFEATLSSELAASLAVAVGSSATVGATVGCKFAQATASATTSTEITAGASWSSTVGTSSSTSSETSKTDEVTSSISFMKESTFTEEESKTLTADDPRGKYYFLAAGTFEIYSVVVYDPIANELQFSVYGKHVDTYPMILYSPDATDVKVDPEIDEIPYDIYEEDIIKTVTNSMFVFYETGHSDVVVDKKKAKSNDSFSLSSEEALPVNDFYSRYGHVFDGWELRDANGNLLVDKIEDGEKVALLSRYAKDYDCRVFKLVARWKTVMKITLNDQVDDTSANGNEIYVHVGKGVFADYEGNKPVEKIEVPKKTGYVFAGYYIEVTNNTYHDASGTTCIINSDGTFADAFKNDGYSYFKDDAEIKALWIRGKYKITLSPEDGTGGSTAIYSQYKTGIYTDSQCTIPVNAQNKIVMPKRTGYTFLGYYDQSGTMRIDENGGIDDYLLGDFTKITSDVTLFARWKANCYKIQYNKNEGTGTMANADHTYDVAKALGQNTFTRIGYTFTGWNTKADGTGTAYANGATVKNLTSANDVVVTLYAQWKAHAYTVQYDANGGAGATDSSEHTYDVDKALSANAFTRVGYSFIGWNTKKDGTGKTYDGGEIVKNLIAANQGTVTLFAQWESGDYVVEYDANGGAGKKTSSVHKYDVDKALTANAFTRTGYTFSGWNTKADGTGTAYVNGATVRNLTSTSGATVTLYAQWKANAYTVRYHANGGAGTMASSAHTYNVNKALTANAFTRTGYTFSGWNTKTDGTGTAYANGAAVKNLSSASGATVTLYAQWKANTYTITFSNPQGAAVSSMKVTYNSTVTLPTPKHRNAEYYQFDQWTYNGKKVDRVFTYTYASSITLVAGETSWRQKYSQYTYIKDRTGLENIANDLSGKYMLICDIDLSQNEWTKLGTFTGELNGDGHAINGLKRFAGVPNGGEEYGLFERLEGATVLNIAFSNVDILVNGGDKNYYKFGALAGSAHASNISGIIVSGSIKIDSSGSGEAWTGGVAGAIYECTVTNCTNNASIKAAKGTGNAGGIAGGSRDTVYTNCSNTGYIHAHNMVMFGNARAGGIVGVNEGSLTNVSCVNSGELKTEGTLGNYYSNDIWP